VGRASPIHPGLSIDEELPKVGRVSTSSGVFLTFAVLVLVGSLTSAGDGPLADAPLARPAPSVLLQDPELGPRWRAVEEEELHARLWYWGWSGFLGAVVAAEVVIAATTENQGAKINAYYNIGFSGAGMLAVLLFPPPAAFGLDAIRGMPEDTEEQRAAKGRALRELFDRAAKQERFYRSTLNHVIGLTVNASLAAILYFGYKLGGRALLTLVAGSAIWEAQVWTHPAAARDAAATEPGLRVSWTFTGNGVGIAGSF
jgi:hypothetical protein